MITSCSKITRVCATIFEFCTMTSRIVRTACITFLTIAFGPGLSNAGAQVAPVVPAAPATPPATRAAEPTTATSTAVSDSGLTDQLLYQYLISEIAGQRGRTGLALRGLMDLAEKTRDPRLARRAVEVAFQARDLTRAFDATSLWLELEPNSPMARQALDALGSSQGTLEEATANLEKLLAQPGRAASVLMQLNALLTRFPDKAAVAAAVKTVTAPHLALAEAHYALSVAYLNAKQTIQSLAAIDDALLKRGDWQQAAIQKSQVLREISDTDANVFLAKFVARNADAHEARLAYARLLAAQKNYADARRQFRIVQKQQPDSIEVIYAVGLLSQQIGEFDDADAAFRRVLALMPRDPAPVLYNLGLVAEARKVPNDAIDWFNKIGAGEYFVGAKQKVAAILAKRDGMAAGRKYLQDAQAAEKDTPETHIQLILAEAQLLRDAKLHEDAFRLLSDAIARNADVSDLLYDRAMVAEKINKLESMEADLRRVIELKPDHAHAYNALGYTFAERNHRLAEAAELVQKAVALAPNDAFIQDSLGWVQFRQGKLDDALQTLKAAYAQRPDPEIAAHLGEIMWVKGMRDEAAKLWRAALKENPDNEMLATVIRKFAP